MDFGFKIISLASQKVGGSAAPKEIWNYK